MQIGSTSFYSPYSTPYRADRMPMATADSTSPSASSAAPTTSTFDFTNMTRSELRDTVNALIKSGRMTLDESTGLVGIMGPAITTSGAAASSSYDQQRVDAFAMLRMGIDGAKSRNEDRSAASYSLALNALQRLQGTPSGVDLRA